MSEQTPSTTDPASLEAYSEPAAPIAAKLAEQLAEGIPVIPEQGPRVEEWGTGRPVNRVERQQAADECYEKGKAIAMGMQEILAGKVPTNLDPEQATALTDMTATIVGFVENPTDERVVLAKADRSGSPSLSGQEPSPEDAASQLIFPGETIVSGAGDTAKAIIDGFAGASTDINRGARGYQFVTTPLENDVSLTMLEAGGSVSLEIGRTPQ